MTINNAVKAFIEDNIDLIDVGNFEAVYVNAYANMYDNAFVRELTQAFDKAGIEVFEARKALLYKMLEEICTDAVTDGENNLHRALDNENNWYGYDIFNIIDFLEQMSYNLGVKLEPIDDRIYKAPNYFIYEA